MKIPKYVQEILERSEYEYSFGDIGYTIAIHKETCFKHIDTLKKEVEKLIAWANRQVPQFEGMETASLKRISNKTHYYDQVAIVTIYDPVMQKIEKYIKH